MGYIPSEEIKEGEGFSMKAIYTKVFKNVWPYWLGGIALAVLNIGYFYLSGKAWRITTGFTYWGAWGFEWIGGNPRDWTYFQYGSKFEGINQYFFSNDLSLMNIGIILGALLAVLLAGQFKFKKIKTPKQAIAALLGGVIMGYSTRIALGCNIGAFYSAIGSLSVSGYVYGLFVFVGAWLGSKVLIKYLL